MIFNNRLNFLNDPARLLNDSGRLLNDRVTLPDHGLKLRNGSGNLLNDRTRLLKDKVKLPDNGASLLNDRANLLKAFARLICRSENKFIVQAGDVFEILRLLKEYSLSVSKLVSKAVQAGNKLEKVFIGLAMQ